MIYHKLLAEIVEFDDSDIVVASTHKECLIDWLTIIPCRHAPIPIGIEIDVPNKHKKKYRNNGPNEDPFSNI